MNRYKGFSLIELMVTVAIIGILASIAIPSYRTYVLQSHRSAAITGLLDLASRQARFYTIQNTYATTMAQLGYAADPEPIGPSSGATYNLSIESADATAFVVKAEPVGKQTSDRCGTYKYTDLGIKTVTVGTVAECWKQ